MNKSVFRFALSAMLLVCLCALFAAQAQQPAKVPRIGIYLPNFASAIADRTEAFRQGLRELGYVEGKDIVIEYRYAEGKLDGLPELAAELVRLKVDVYRQRLVRLNRRQKRTKTIPIVMARPPILWATSLLPALRSQAGTSLGCPSSAPEICGKRLELLKETFPSFLASQCC